MRQFSKERCLEILGLSPNSKPAEVQRAFRKRVHECHPDVAHSDPAAEAELKKVVMAYRTLMSGKAMTREELLTEAWTTSSSTDRHPTGADVLPKFQIAPAWVAIISLCVLALALIGYKAIYTLESWTPWFDTPAWMEMSDAIRAALAIVFTAQFAGAGAAAAAGSDARYSLAISRGVLGGVGFIGIASLTGFLQPVLMGDNSAMIFLNLAVVFLSGCIGASVGASLVVWMQFNGFAFYASGGQSLVARRAMTVVAACLSLGAFWVFMSVIAASAGGVLLAASVLVRALGLA